MNDFNRRVYEEAYNEMLELQQKLLAYRILTVIFSAATLLLGGILLSR